jgi:hypothetical protein
MKFFLFRLAKVYAWEEVRKSNPPTFQTEPLSSLKIRNKWDIGTKKMELF